MQTTIKPTYRPSQSSVIHAETPNPAGASWNFGMAAPSGTPCIDARLKATALLPTWRSLHSHGPLFGPN